MKNWEHVIYFSDLTQKSGLKFADREAIADRIVASKWYQEVQAEDDFSDLADYVEELREVQDVQGFKVAMGAIYDEADDRGCFLDTVSPMPSAVNA